LDSCSGLLFLVLINKDLMKNYVKMKILAVDIGAGTLDILLYDSDKNIENCFKI